MFRIDEDGCEFVAVVPDMWEYEQDEDEVIIIEKDQIDKNIKSSKKKDIKTFVIVERAEINRFNISGHLGNPTRILDVFKGRQIKNYKV